MRIKRLRIHVNFRSYEDETLEFDSYTPRWLARTGLANRAYCAP